MKSIKPPKLKPSPHTKGANALKTKKSLLVVVAAILTSVVLVVGLYFAFFRSSDSVENNVQPAEVEGNALQATINQYSNQVSSAEEHMFLATLYSANENYTAAVESIEKAYEISDDTSLLAKQSVILMEHLDDKGSDILRRNIDLLAEAELMPETTYRIANLLEDTDLQPKSNSFYEYTLSNYDKMIDDKLVSREQLRNKINDD